MTLGPHDIVLIDIKTTELTLFEVLARIDQYKMEPMFRDYEIQLDGDVYAIVATPKACLKDVFL